MPRKMADATTMVRRIRLLGFQLSGTVGVHQVDRLIGYAFISVCSMLRSRALSHHRVLLHVDCHPHPWMDAALKMMLTPRQPRDLELTALKDPGLGHLEVGKAAGTFGNRLLSSIEIGYEPAAELLHLGERVRLAALVGYD